MKRQVYRNCERMKVMKTWLMKNVTIMSNVFIKVLRDGIVQRLQRTAVQFRVKHAYALIEHSPAVA